MKNKSILLAGLAVISLASCKPNLDTGEASAGPLDLSSYVAVGNSLTAGFADGSLYLSGQQNSYPAILAQQFRMVGGGDFKIPYLKNNYGFPYRKYELRITVPCSGPPALGPLLEDAAKQAASVAENEASVVLGGPYNNMGVPGIRAIDFLFPVYYQLNPYSKRFFSGPALAEINRAKATFFTAWIGNNDVLAYATNGGVGKGSGGGIADQNSISSIPLFSMAVDSVLNRMTAGGAKGAVINIPDVTSIPYFTTVPAMGLKVSADTAALLNAAYGALGMHFTAGYNYWIIADTSIPGPYKFRQMKSGELLLLTLPQDSLRCRGWGSLKPIPAQYVLDATEINNVKVATNAFNGLLKAAADARGLAYVDINTYFKSFQTGVTFNGVTYTTVFASGGTFSLDGIHLTPRGYAFAANEIIRTVNRYYKSSIPTVDVNRYDGVKFP